LNQVEIKKIKFKTAKFLTGFKFVLIELAITTNKLCFFSVGISCIVTGWGYYKIIRLPNGQVDYLEPDRLQFLPMKIVDFYACKKQNEPGFVTLNNICASAGMNSSTYKV
jgi:hypothetical protein